MISSKVFPFLTAAIVFFSWFPYADCTKDVLFYQRVLELPTFYLRLVTVDEGDLDLMEFQKHLQNSTQFYLSNSFQNSHTFIPRKNTDQRFEFLNLQSERFTRAFMGHQDLDQQDLGAPASLIVNTFVGNVTFVDKGMEQAPSNRDIQRTKTKLSTIMRFSLHDNMDQLWAVLHQNPFLRIVIKLEAVIVEERKHGDANDPRPRHSGHASFTGNNNEPAKESFLESDHFLRIFVGSIAVILWFTVLVVCVLMCVLRGRVIQRQTSGGMDQVPNRFTKNGSRKKEKRLVLMNETGETVGTPDTVQPTLGKNDNDNDNDNGGGGGGDGDDDDDDDEEEGTGLLHTEWAQKLARFERQMRATRQSSETPSFPVPSVVQVTIYTSHD